MLWWMIFFAKTFISGLCYNLDVEHPIIIENPDVSQEKSYFGYSVVLYAEGKYGEKWLQIGAPKATYYDSRREGDRETIQNSGVVYHCPYKKKCTTENRLKYNSKINFDEKGNLTGAWTGGSMDISYKYKTLAISASNWHYFASYGGQRSARLRGGIFLSHSPNSTLQKCSPLKEPLIHTSKPLRGISYYARAQTGFFLHFVKNENELLIGAPGANNYVGTVLKLENIEKMAAEWDYKVMSPDGNYHEYAGYAVTSGHFFKRYQLLYVSGLPRGKQRTHSMHMLYGAVLIFTFKHRELSIRDQYDIELKAKFHGTQFGEYFGASLAAGDLNGDDLDDLIVGAPFRTNEEDGFNHGSVYVIFGNKKKMVLDTKNRIDGTVSNGLFGQAVVFLENLDNDGFKGTWRLRQIYYIYLAHPPNAFIFARHLRHNNENKFAVSAPQEDNSGVVYVYTYNEKTKRFLVSQKISGNDLYPNLKGFGMSFSRPRDIDNNNFPDILIGAPISGHAILLRSKPIVLVQKHMKVNSTLSKSNTSLSFTCCYSYSDEFLESTLTILRNLTVDGDLRRFSFKHSEFDNQSEEKEIAMEGNREYCEIINVYKLNLIHFNYDDPISITLTYRVPKNETANRKNPIIISDTDTKPSKDTFCKNCPLLSHKSSKSETKLVMWDHLCGDQTCVSQLVVHAEFSNLRKNNTYVVGSKESLLLKVTVLNKKDPAFTPQLEITLPNGVFFRRDPLDCDNSEGGKVTCDLGEELVDKVTYNYELNIDEAISETEITFFLNSSTTTLSIDDESRFNITLTLKKEVDFEITGMSKESTYIYAKTEPTKIQNIFKVEKEGPSPISEIEIHLLIPYEIKDSKGVLKKFVEIQEYQGQNAGSQMPKCKNMTEDEGSIANLTTSDGYGSDKNNTDFLSDLKHIFYINCTMDNVKCLLVKCWVGPFDSIQKYAEVAIEMEVNFEDLEDMVKPEELILITSVAYILIENFTQCGNRSDYTEISNLLIIEKEYRISMWILVGSAIAGLIILILLSTCLAKAGFFERKEQQKLRQLKEEAVEEERLLQEMIEKELVKGDCDHVEENEFYGFLRHHKPNQQQKHELIEENEFYGDLLKK